MKRNISENNFVDLPSNSSLSDSFTASFVKRNKLEKPKLVNGCDKLAEKVAPGYLVKLAEDIENANEFMYHSSCGRLKIIEDQMKLLKQQAVNILIETRISSILHSLPCNFLKKVGSVYSVYKKQSGEYYFSMLNPQEWGSSALHEYIGSFKLEGAMSWTPVDKYSELTAIQCWVQQDQEQMMIEEN